MKTFRCPVCKKPLTKKEYEEALGIWQERQEHFEHEQNKLKKELRLAQVAMKRAKREGEETAQKRVERQLRGKNEQIEKLKRTVRQLQKGTTPQTEGLEWEAKLAARLKREFPGDDIQPKGQQGDVLHIVKLNQRSAGAIIYECKRTIRINDEYIAQARIARKSREADFAVLVTTGRKRGFSGFMQADGVFIVSPLGVVSLAGLLRQHLIEMLKLEISKEERAIIAQRLVGYIASPQFKNPLEEVVRRATGLQEMLRREVRGHFGLWKRRWEHYQVIQWDGTRIQQNLQLVMHGQEPKPIDRPRAAPLQLPMPQGRKNSEQATD
jgi:hypothetical protein